MKRMAVSLPLMLHQSYKPRKFHEQLLQRFEDNAALVCEPSQVKTPAPGDIHSMITSPSSIPPSKLQVWDILLINTLFRMLHLSRSLPYIHVFLYIILVPSGHFAEALLQPCQCLLLLLLMFKQLSSQIFCSFVLKNNHVFYNFLSQTKIMPYSGFSFFFSLKWYLYGLIENFHCHFYIIKLKLNWV